MGSASVGGMVRKRSAARRNRTNISASRPIGRLRSTLCGWQRQHAALASQNTLPLLGQLARLVALILA